MELGTALASAAVVGGRVHACACVKSNTHTHTQLFVFLLASDTVSLPFIHTRAFVLLHQGCAVTEHIHPCCAGPYTCKADTELLTKVIASPFV